MNEKISIEEEKKLISLKTYVDKIEGKQILEPIISEKKSRMVDVVKSLLIPLGITIQDVRKVEKEIYELAEDEMLAPIYNKDPDWHRMNNYISYSKKRFLVQEQIMYRMADFIVDVLDSINDIQKTSPEPEFNQRDDGTPRLSSKEREEIKRRAHQLVIYYKRVSTVKQKAIIIQLYKQADTKEKFNIIDDVFFDLTGERALTKMKKEREKPSEVDNLESGQFGE